MCICGIEFGRNQGQTARINLYPMVLHGKNLIIAFENEQNFRKYGWFVPAVFFQLVSMDAKYVVAMTRLGVRLCIECLRSIPGFRKFDLRHFKAMG